MARSPTKQSVSVHYYASSPNFGDALNTTMLSQLLRRPVEHAGPESADLFAIGSVLEALLHRGNRRKRIRQLLTRPQVQVWGTGFIGPRGVYGWDDLLEPERFARRIRLLAVRGRLTLERCQAMGLRTEGSVLGEPGLLAPQTFGMERSATRSCSRRIGVVPHYADLGAAELESAFRHVDTEVIDVREHPQQVISRIAACDVILSSSLHGLVIADALGIPNQRLRLGDRVIGGAYKFDDYHSALDLPPQPEIDLRSSELTPRAVARAEAEYCVEPSKVDEVVAGLRAALAEFRL